MVNKEVFVQLTELSNFISLLLKAFAVFAKKGPNTRVLAECLRFLTDYFGAQGLQKGTPQILRGRREELMESENSRLRLGSGGRWH
jgi:hypothetical protein